MDFDKYKVLNYISFEHILFHFFKPLYDTARTDESGKTKYVARKISAETFDREILLPAGMSADTADDLVIDLSKDILSRFRTKEGSIYKSIISAYLNPDALGNIKRNFETDIISVMNVDAKKNLEMILRRLIEDDSTIDSGKRNSLLNFDSFTDLLSEAYLYSMIRYSIDIQSKPVINEFILKVVNDVKKKGSSAFLSPAIQALFEYTQKGNLFDKNEEFSADDVEFFTNFVLENDISINERDYDAFTLLKSFMRGYINGKDS